MKDAEKQMLDYLEGIYEKDKKIFKESEEYEAEEKLSFFFQGIFNGINLCIEFLNCEVSEEFATKCNENLDKLIEEINGNSEEI